LSLKFILDLRLTTILQHTWVSKLFGYDFAVEYRQGKFNVVADALSRRDEESLVTHALSAPSFLLYGQLWAEINELPQTVQIHKQITDCTASPWWLEKDGLLLFQDRILLPDESVLWPLVLEHAHTMGHEGNEKTLHWFRAVFYSPHARRRVHDYV
jgi:hypothetical protein